MNRAGYLIVVAIAACTFLPGERAGAADWVIIPEKSWLGFKGTMAGVPFEGRFGRWDARISFDAANLGHSHALVTIDMFSAITGDKQKDEALPQSDWFDAKSFPKAIFEARSFHAGGSDSYEAIGTLTIRNIARAVRMPMTIVVNDATLHATGHLELVRTDYGVGRGDWASGEWVAPEVVARFDVTARLQH